MKTIIRILFFPFSLFYGFIVCLRNLFYDTGVFRTTSFSLPIISVGNLTVGGTGKTPHVEYLIRLLLTHYRIAMLSRGYKRKTKGFVLADVHTTVSSIGDEALQIKSKFPNIHVAVAENRVIGVHNLLQKSDTEVIILDDAFQHRRIKPSLSILLMDYNRLPFQDSLLPSGRLREPFKQKKRADIIIVSKCPKNISIAERKRLKNKIDIAENQSIYFSYIIYKKIRSVFPFIENKVKLPKADAVLLVAGIANPKMLKEYTLEKYKEVSMLRFRDHYLFKADDIEKICQKFEQINSNNKIIITTEKDAIRLRSMQQTFSFGTMIEYMYYLPMEIKIFADRQENFDSKILNFIAHKF